MHLRLMPTASLVVKTSAKICSVLDVLVLLRTYIQCARFWENQCIYEPLVHGTLVIGSGASK